MLDKLDRKGPRRDAVKERYWRRMIKQFERTDSSVRAFCQKHEISENLFYSWRREILRRDMEATENLDPSAIAKPRRRVKNHAKSQVARAKKQGKKPRKKTRPLFAPVTIIADGASPVAPIEVVLDEITVRVPSEASRESLVMVLSALDVLRQSPC